MYVCCAELSLTISVASSRKILLTPHSNPADPVCLDVLTTAYHTLLCATLTTWTPTNPLTPTAFVEFVNSILSSLPSSSTTSSKGTSNATIFGDHLVDMIWSVDTELDELLIEARAATAATATGEPGKPPSREAVMLSTKTKKALSNVENDKQRIPVILRRLLVCICPFRRVPRLIQPILCRTTKLLAQTIVVKG